MKTGAASVSQQLGLLLQQVNFRDSRQENMGKLAQRLFNQFQHSLYLKTSSWWGKRLQLLDFVQSCQPAVSIGWSGIQLEHVGWKYVCEPRTNKTHKVRGMRPFILSFSKGSHLHGHPTRRAPHQCAPWSLRPGFCNICLGERLGKVSSVDVKLAKSKEFAVLSSSTRWSFTDSPFRPAICCNGVIVMVSTCINPKRMQDSNRLW